MFDDGGDLPKVSAVRSTRPMHASAAFAMLSRFLETEQEKQDPGAIQHSHWEDLYRVSETLVSTNADQARLRNLRLAAPKSVASLRPALVTNAFDDEIAKTPVRIKHETLTKEGEVAVGDTQLTEEDEKERKKAAKQVKREKKEAKKRKRENTPS